MFADEMDIMSLTQWRLTCKTNYYQAVGSLKQSLTKMLDHFVPNPDFLLRTINKTRSVIGGEFALAFLLRDLSMLPKQLDVYASDYEFTALCTYLLEDPDISRTITQYTRTQNPVLDALRLLVSSVLIIETTKGTSIRIHRSYMASSAAPLSRASCTALSNFITAHGYGCSHPLLTLNRRALIADQDIPQLFALNVDVQDRLIKHGFSLAFSPIAWLEFRRPVDASALDEPSSNSQNVLDDPVSAPLEDVQPRASSAGPPTTNNSQVPSVVSSVVSPVASDGADRHQVLHDAPPSDTSCSIAIASPHRRDNVGQSADSVSLDDTSYTHDVSSFDAMSAQVVCCSDGAGGDNRHGRLSYSTATQVDTYDVGSLPALAYSDTGDTPSVYASPNLIMLPGMNASVLPLHHNDSDQHMFHGTLSDISPLVDVTQDHGVDSPAKRLAAHDVGVAGSSITVASNSGIQCDDSPARGDTTSIELHSSDGVTGCAYPGGDGDLSALSGRSPFPDALTPHGDNALVAVPCTVQPIAVSISSGPIDNLGAYTVVYFAAQHPNVYLLGPSSSGNRDAAAWRSRHSLQLHCSCPHTGNDQALDADGASQTNVQDGPEGLAHDSPVSGFDEDDEYIVSADGNGDGSNNGENSVTSGDEDDESAGSADEDSDEASTSEGSTTTGDEGDLDDGDSDAGTEEEHTDPEQCWCHLYICPSQGRFFGDRGSFVNFFDPLTGCEAYCAVKSITPFGPMVVWRVLSTFDCEEGCDIYDDVLEDDVTSVPVLFRQDPFGELRSVVSEDLIGGGDHPQSLLR